MVSTDAGTDCLPVCWITLYIDLLPKIEKCVCPSVLRWFPVAFHCAAPFELAVDMARLAGLVGWLGWVRRFTICTTVWIIYSAMFLVRFFCELFPTLVHL